jgi:hypothetical protein
MGTCSRPFRGCKILDRRGLESLLKLRPSASTFLTEVFKIDFTSEVMVENGESGAQMVGSSTMYSVLWTPTTRQHDRQTDRQ